MKKKKFELIVVIAMMLTLIINTTCVSANDKTNDDYSIPQKIIDIANGSDEIYGEGVPIEHIDPNKPQPKFTSGGIDHTHQQAAPLSKLERTQIIKGVTQSLSANS